MSTENLKNACILLRMVQRENFFVEEEVMRSMILAFAALATLLLCVACSSNPGDNASYKDNVKKAPGTGGTN
jgi:hypothetical protein